MKRNQPLADQLVIKDERISDLQTERIALKRRVGELEVKAASYDNGQPWQTILDINEREMRLRTALLRIASAPDSSDAETLRNIAREALR